MESDSRIQPTMHLDQMAEWEAWLKSSEYVELMQSNTGLHGSMIKPKSVVELEHYATQLERFCQGIFHEDNISRYPVLLHKCSCCQPGFMSSGPTGSLGPPLYFQLQSTLVKCIPSKHNPWIIAS